MVDSLSSLSFLYIDPVSWGVGTFFTLFIYLLNKIKRGREKGIKSRSSFMILMTDFWFDEFFTRKIVSFIYFLTLVLFNSTVIDTLIVSKDYYSYGVGSTIIFGRLLSVLLLVTGVRIVLELVISNIKMSQNTLMMRNYMIDNYERNLNQNPVNDYQEDTELEDVRGDKREEDPLGFLSNTSVPKRKEKGKRKHL